MNTTMIITYFITTKFTHTLLTGFSFHTMKPLHNYLKTNIHKRTLKNDMISNQQIITGFFFILWSHCKMISIVMSIPEYYKYRKPSNNNRNLGAQTFHFFFSLWSHCIMTSIPFSAQESYILNVKQQRKHFMFDWQKRL